MDGKIYIGIVKLFYNFLITEFGFNLTKETENGNAFYNIEYTDAARTISVSYENIEDYLLVIVFKLKNGQLPEYDDKSLTLHLSELNRIILSQIDKTAMEENNGLFSKFEPKSNSERKLLKSAKELRLCLKHWDKI